MDQKLRVAGLFLAAGAALPGCALVVKKEEPAAQEQRREAPAKAEKAEKAKQAPAFAQPEPKPKPATDEPATPAVRAALAEFNAAYEEHRAAFEDPSSVASLDAHCYLEQLRQAGTLADEASYVFELRHMAWRYARARHGVEAAHPLPGEAPWGSKERDRLVSIVNEVHNLFREGRGHLLDLQRPEVVKMRRRSLARYRAELDAFSKELGETSHYYRAEAYYRIAALRLEAILAEAARLKAQAGDVPAQLARYQETFPQDSFDPSFKGEQGPEAYERWARQLANYDAGIADALKFFEVAAKSTAEASEPAFRAYVQWFRDSVKERLKRARQAAMTPLSRKVSNGIGACNGYTPEDANDEVYKKTIAKINAGVEAAPLLMGILRGAGESTRELEAKLDRLQETSAKLSGKAKAAIEGRKLAPSALKNAKLEGIAKKTVPLETRSLRITSKPSQYAYDEISGGFLVRTWYKRYWVEYATPQGGKWYFGRSAIEQRVTNKGNPIGGWYLASELPAFKRQILEKNID